MSYRKAPESSVWELWEGVWNQSHPVPLFDNRENWDSEHRVSWSRVQWTSGRDNLAMFCDPCFMVSHVPLPCRSIMNSQFTPPPSPNRNCTFTHAFCRSCEALWCLHALTIRFDAFERPPRLHVHLTNVASNLSIMGLGRIMIAPC